MRDHSALEHSSDPYAPMLPPVSIPRSGVKPRKSISYYHPPSVMRCLIRVVFRVYGSDGTKIRNLMTLLANSVAVISE